MIIINKQNEWLELGQKLTENCITRQDKIRDLSHEFTSNEKERKEINKDISKLNREISKLAHDMEKLESKGFGIIAIIETPTQLQRITLTLMVIARLSSTLIKRELEEVGDIANSVAGTDLKNALTVRNFFREDSKLCRNFSLQHCPTLDESAVRLTEKALNLILGQESDISEILTSSKLLKSTWRMS